MLYRFLGISKFGGSALSVNVSAAIVVCLWIYNVAFNIPMFIWADVRTNHIGRTTCYPPGFHPIFALASCIINVFVPLSITWTSNIGIVYKFKRSANKVILAVSIYTGQNHFIKYCEAPIVNSILWTSNQRWNSNCNCEVFLDKSGYCWTYRPTIWIPYEIPYTYLVSNFQHAVYLNHFLKIRCL